MQATSSSVAPTQTDFAPPSLCTVRTIHFVSVSSRSLLSPNVLLALIPLGLCFCTYKWRITFTASDLTLLQ